MTLSRYDPTGEMVTLREAMDRLFEDSFIRPFRTARDPFPVDLKETKEAYVLTAALPGYKPDDLTIEATAEAISIKGERKEQKESKDGEYIRREMRSGSVARSIGLPQAIDPTRVEATFENGVVTLTLPKTQAAKATQVKVKTSAA